MKKESKNKGITLIALIITIIVMLILVGVTVNVALNGGLFSTAKRAASGMQMAQIREKAEVVKATLIAEAQSNNSIIVSKTEYKNRLLQEFEGSTAVGSKVVVENEKYDIIIKNTDLDIEVVEHSDNAEPGSLVALDYTTSNIEEDGKTYVVNTKLSLTRLMDSTKYSELRAKEDTGEGEVTPEMKRQAVIEYMSESYGEEFTTIEEAILYDINNNWYGTEYTTLEECLEDENVKADWGTVKEQIYYNFYTYEFSGEGKEMTEEEMIEAFYKDSVSDKYINEFNKYTLNLSVYVENDGTQELIKDKVNLAANPTTINYAIVKNGKYEFVVKTIGGEEIVREAMQINNIATPNPYVLTKEEAEGIWETDENGTITKYIGQDTNVVVPMYIGTEYIRNIGNKAFYKCENIVSVNMCNNIISIDSWAFSNCTSLEIIKLPENITVIKSCTFDACKVLKNIIIPENVNSIENCAFRGCEILENIDLPENITLIGYSAFQSCKALKNITIPDKVRSIGSNAFSNCKSLLNIKLPENITVIYQYTFSGCEALKNITIPKNVRKIVYSAFEGCKSLENIELSENLTEIENWAFRNCESLKNIKLPKNVTKIAYNVFENCSKLEEVIFEGEKLTIIYPGAFKNCIALRSITIPNSVTNMGYSTDKLVFDGCTNLTTINFTPGDNPIPEGQPWGAPNENLVVTKLTQ